MSSASIQSSINALSETLVGRLYRRLSALSPSSGEVSELRAVFEYAVAAMLEGEKRVFATQYSRLVYLCSRMGADDALTAAVTACARRMAGAGAADAQAGDRGVEGDALLDDLLYVLYRFSGVRPEDAALSERLRRREAACEAGAAIPSQDAEAGQRENTEVFYGVVTEVSALHSEQDGRYFVLQMIPRPDAGGASSSGAGKRSVRVSSRYPDGTLREDLMRLREILRPYWSLNLTDLQAGESPGTFCTTSSTLAIVEPDYLVDVTDIAACFSFEQANPNVFLLSKLMPSRDSEAMFRGTLINDLLDAYLEGNEVSPQAVFRRALSRNLLKAARYGGRAVGRIWQEVVGEHRANIEAFAAGLRDQRVSVEPSFISALYGMQGRLDVLTEWPDDPSLKNIYELKSGRPPGGTALWRAHQVQVACYDMLLTSVYGRERRGTSALFYSAGGPYPLRNFLSSSLDRQEILALRNELIDRVYRLAEGDFSPLEDLCPERFGPHPAYLRQAVADYAAFYARLSPVQGKYYRAFMGFTLREMLAAKTGAFLRAGREGTSSHGYAALWRDTYDCKRENFAAIDSLAFEWYDRREHLLHFSIREPLEHTLRAGDTVVLYPYLGGRGDVLRNRVVKATLRQVEPRHLAVLPRGTRGEPDFFRSVDRWVLEHDMMERGYWSSVAGLFLLLGEASPARAALFGQAEPGRTEFPYRENTALTPGQNRAVRQALQARDYFLLQGPPGTGKTSGALMGIVSNLLEHTQDTVTILAFTNRAVAEIAHRLSCAGIDCLRLGHLASSDEEATLSRMSEGLKVNQVRELIASSRVILSTVSTYVSRADDLKELVRRDVVLVDEASQLTEAQLGGVLAGFRKFILLGDQKQLPAVTQQSAVYAATDDLDLQALEIGDLRDSLFERLWRYSVRRGFEGVCSMLDTHFRMHEEIADLVNPFYHGLLRSGTERQKAPAEIGFRLCFIPSDYEPSYKRHRGEAAAVAKILREIKDRYGRRFTEDTVGVVTPWRAQVGAIRAAVDDPQILEKVTIDTVERFQGGEKDIILVSMAVFDPSQMELLESVDGTGSVDRKLNVTVSRAREKLVVLGYEPALRASRFYAELLDRMHVEG